jgi:hypothetical protein
MLYPSSKIAHDNKNDYVIKKTIEDYNQSFKTKMEYSSKSPLKGTELTSRNTQQIGHLAQLTQLNNQINQNLKKTQPMMMTMSSTQGERKTQKIKVTSTNGDIKKLLNNDILTPSKQQLKPSVNIYQTVSSINRKYTSSLKK